MEQLIRAEQSTDLSDLKEQLGDIDFIRAAGMVAQKHPAAIAAWRLIELRDQRSAREVFDYLVAALISLGHDHDPINTAARVLTWMADPTCPHCKGRGFETMAGTPLLSDHECTHCHGSGKRERDWDDGAHAVYEWLMSQQRQAAAAIIAKMRQD